MKRLGIVLLALLLSAVPAYAVFGGAARRVRPTTVANLGSATTTGLIAQVTDGDNDADCTVGGGAFKVFCMSNGSTWEPTGDSSSAAGDVSGPGASLDNEIARFNSTTGKIIQAYTSGGPTVGDTGDAAFNANVTIKGPVPYADVEAWGAVCDTTTDDTVAIQAAIDSLDTTGGKILFPPKRCGISAPLTLDNGQEIVGTCVEWLNTATTCTRIGALATWSGTAMITDQGVTVERGMAVRNIHLIARSGVESAILFDADEYVTIEGVRAWQTDGAAIHLKGAGKAGFILNTVVLVAVQGTTLAGDEGALTVEWSDSFITRVEATTSSTDYSEGGKRVGILITGANNTIIDSIGEISETGVMITGATNRLHGVRADLNRGDGFVIKTSGANQIVGCLALRNGKQTTNTYDGFLVSSTNNIISSSLANSSSSTEKHRYGFNDTSGGLTNIYMANKDFEATTAAFNNAPSRVDGDLEVVGIATLTGETDLGTSPTLFSNTDIILQLDEDADGTNSAIIQDGADVAIFTFQEDGVLLHGATINDDVCDTAGEWWWDTTDVKFEFCELSSGAPTRLTGSGEANTLASPDVGAEVDLINSVSKTGTALNLVSLEADDFTVTANIVTIDDSFLLNSTSDTMVGTLTADGLTLGANENIQLGAQLLDHDGTDFVFNDTVRATEFTTGPTATPNVFMIDSHANAGEAKILLDGNAAGPDSLLDLQVDVAGTLVSFIQLDGITETVDLLKSATGITPSVDDSSTTLATTAFVQDETVAAGDVTGTLATGLTIGAGTVEASMVAADVATQAEIDLKAPLAGPTFTGTLVIEGLADIGTLELFGATDVTPDVSTGIYFATDGTAQTLTDFDGTPLDGQILYVESTDATIFDCTASGLDCGSVNITTAAGDLTTWLYTGTQWQLIAFKDQSTDMGTDDTGSGSLGSNLTSTTNDILSDVAVTSAIVLGGVGTEALTFDFETTANEVGMSSTTGVTTVDFGTINVEADQLVSDIATGTSPLVVASTTVVTNLDADTVDGFEGHAIFSPNADPGINHSGLSGDAGIAEVAGGISTASGETDFLASGALTCTTAQQGRMQVHTTALQYCDNDATPTLRYAAFSDSAGLITDFSNANDLDAAGDIPAAGLSTQGIIEIATGAETNTGTDATRAVSPDALEDWEGSAFVTTTGALATGSMDASSSFTLTTTSKIYMPAATCQNATATANFDTPTTNAAAAACKTGTNIQMGVLDFDQTTSESVQANIMLPTDFTGVVDVDYTWLSGTGSTAPVVWCSQIVCIDDDEVDDDAFPAQATGNCVSDAGKATLDDYNEASDTAITISEGTCSAGEMMYIKISRDPAEVSTLTDTHAADARLLGVTYTLRRAQ